MKRYPTNDQVINARTLDTDELLRRAVAAVKRVWPLAQFVDPASGNYYGANADIPVTKLTAFHVFKNGPAREANALPAGGETVQLIASKGVLTFASGRPADAPEVDSLFEALDLELRGIA